MNPEVESAFHELVSDITPNPKVIDALMGWYRSGCPEGWRLEVYLPPNKLAEVSMQAAEFRSDVGYSSSTSVNDGTWGEGLLALADMPIPFVARGLSEGQAGYIHYQLLGLQIALHWLYKFEWRRGYRLPSHFDFKMRQVTRLLGERLHCEYALLKEANDKLNLKISVSETFARMIQERRRLILENAFSLAPCTQKVPKKQWLAIQRRGMRVLRNYPDLWADRDDARFALFLGKDYAVTERQVFEWIAQAVNQASDYQKKYWRPYLTKYQEEIDRFADSDGSRLYIVDGELVRTLGGKGKAILKRNIIMPSRR